ncbi:2Fe-2S iron-sulfur cluster-binding protein [Aquimarina hainanensis]|uniref:2Fe-2S iron-sulfur cluster-binding protein n=1 Tax=Aquimarina hainanensis TaxID=1578017 RepID=A0ABW5N834_9FLAO|nr:ferredoxin--NADP reductase [Aquimarina sp. TRL1]QKX04726.1 ferredoxin--NADP reductase [Aquimarina sp. TRL1]
MSTFHSLSIKDITRETSKAVAITFDIPTSLKEQYQFIPGQYLTLKTTINGNEVRRAYSICSAPDDHFISVAIKEIENGLFSTYANQQLTSDDVIEVHPPEGTFTLATSPTANKTYCAFAAGSGITPIMSMIYAVLQNEPNSRFVLVYGNKTPEETIFHTALTTLQAKYPDRFFIEFIYSRSNEVGTHFGRIERSTINFIVKNKYKDYSFDNFFLCGPEVMISTAKEVLLENAVAEDQIHFELFTSSSSTSSEGANQEGKTNITILVDDEEVTFVMDRKKTILEAAIEEDIDVPYSCQGGVCSSCICKITEGTAVMSKNGILTDSEIEEGLVLACVSHATTDTVFVDFDDV